MSKHTQPEQSDTPRLGVWFYPTPSDAGYPYECECGNPLTVKDLVEGYCPGCDREFVGTLTTVVRRWYSDHSDSDRYPPITGAPGVW